MQEFPALAVVRVKSIFDTAIGSKRLTSKDNLRTPQVGDVGTIVDILRTPNARHVYIVECCNDAGETIWLCEFQADELEMYSPS
jgi:hypothetical protein